MAKAKWRGDAPNIADVWTATPGGTIAATDIFTLTINGKDVTFTATTTTVSHVVTGLVTAWNLSTVPEHAEYAAADTGTTHITLTAKVAGVPGTITSSITDVSGAPPPTLAMSNTTPATGSAFADNAANWSTGAVPIDDTDSVVFEGSSKPMYYGLDQSAIDLTGLEILKSYTGTIGLSEYNASGYKEYRGLYWQIGSPETDIGLGEGSGSGRIKIDNGSDLSVIRVWGTGSPAETGIPSFLWKGTETGETNTMIVNKGSVGIAFFAGDTSKMTSLTVGYDANRARDATVFCGPDLSASLPTILQTGGTLDIETNITAATITGGVLTISGTATVGALRADGGTTYYTTSGTMTTLDISGGAVLDLTRSTQTRTISTINMYEDAIIIDPAGTLPNGTAYNVIRTNLQRVQIQGPESRKWTMAST